MKVDNEVETLISFCCKELDLKNMEFSFDLSCEDPKKLAKLLIHENDGPKSLSLSEHFIVPFDLYYQIAKEIRRAWQISHRPNLLFGYKQEGELDFEEFHLQKAEVDAHAYAAVSVMDHFHITPLFEGLTGKIIGAIRHRIDEIVDERDHPEYYEEDCE